MSNKSTSAPRRLGRPPGSNREDRRAAILDAALTCFAKAGYQSTTNQDVATKAGVTTGALYHYFDSKEDLYVAVFEEVQTRIFESYRTSTAGMTDFFEIIDTILDVSVSLNQGNPAIAAFWNTLAVEAQRHPELSHLSERQRRGSSEFWLWAVTQGRKYGSIEPVVDDETTVHVISSVLGGLSRMSVINLSLTQHKKAAEAIKLLLRGSLLNSPA